MQGSAGTFWAVLGALVVFGVIVLGYMALPKDEPGRLPAVRSELL